MQSLSEQIETFSPTMSLDTPAGSMVRFIGRNGHQWQLDEALEVLEVGREYEVLSVDVGGFSSRVFLADGAFNTVMFENI